LYDEDDEDDERDARDRPLLPSGTRAYRCFLRALLTAATTTMPTATTRMTPRNMAPPSFRSPEAAPRGRLAVAASRAVTGGCPAGPTAKAELRNF
jgi:hypothetical protein